MTLLARKFFLYSIAVMLSASPVAVDAADKNNSKRVISSSKYKLIKYKTGSRKIHTRLRAKKSVAYVDSYDGSSPLRLASAKALVINQLTGETIFAKNTDLPTPIA